MSDHKPNIIFRADGNSEIGLGHMVRSSALASAINKNYCCTLATRCNIQEILRGMSNVFNKIIELPEKDYYSEAERFLEISPSGNLIILDGYSFDTRYQEILAGKGYEFFSIDDIHASYFFSKAIINHSGGLTALDYKAGPGTQFYLGPYYSLLRKPFLDAAKKRRTVIDNKACFVCFGGADPKSKTLEVLENKDIRDRFDYFHVVTGSGFQNQKKLTEITATQKNISLYSSLPAEDVISVMQRCSFAICSPSTIAYEYMSVGGVVFLEQIADNQKDVIQYMTGEGLAFFLKDFGSKDEYEFYTSLKKQAKYFDGQSGERFRKIFEQYFDAKEMIVRKANEDDLEICFNWANDALVREQSYNQELILLTEHKNWFYQKLKDPDSFFYIIEIDQKPVAQIRFQVNGHEAVLGYLADKTIRNKGLGTSILSKGIEKFIADYKKAIVIIGFVKNSNIASQKSFEKLSFTKEISAERPESVKYTMHFGD
jgi:UDP-2,4-diacetamido-2,4,6-trideoxy-beta-L-altropyranose hydrolase